jgi:PPOX class probable F420-dependent enzyme
MMTATLDPAIPEHAHAIDRLAVETVGWLTTVDPAGDPHASPVWYLWEDGEVLLYSRTRAPRNGFVAAHPTVAFNLNTDPTGDDVVTMEGVARIDPDAPPAHEHPVYLAKYAGRIAGYGWTPEWFSEAYAVAMRITPTRWRL